MTRQGHLLLFTLCLTSVAEGSPMRDATVGTVNVEDTAGKRRPLPDPDHAVVIIYEDQEAAKRPQPARELFGRYTRRAQNRAVFEFVAVADVAKWSWWPAKKHVLADVKKIEERNNTRVYLDWSGEVRKRWGLIRGQSGVIILASNGKVRFAAEGSLSPAQEIEVHAVMAALGARLEEPRTP